MPLVAVYEVAEVRLQQHVTVLQNAPSVKRVAEQFLGLLCDGSGAAHGAIVKDLALYNFESSKAALLAGVYEEEVAQYTALDEQIESDIETTKQEIEGLKASLMHERATRLHKEECKALSRTVNALPVRGESQKCVGGTAPLLRRCTRGPSPHLTRRAHSLAGTGKSRG